MKKSLLFIFALISLSSLSQSIWTKGNAVWHYRFYNISSGYIKVWEDGDTTLQNQVCTKLKSVKHEFFTTGPNGGLMETSSDYIQGAVYVSNDTVYYWDIDHFSVLYDFSAQVGDQWLLQTGVNPSFDCNDTSVAIVESVGAVNIGGQNYTELTMGYAPDANCFIQGKANSRFGALGYLLPFPRSCDSTIIVEWDQLSFLCFEDDSLFYNPSGEACEIHLGLEETEMNKVSVFPNPSSGNIELLSELPLKQIQVINMIGSTLKEFRPNVTLVEIDLSELPQGTYYLNLENQNGEKVVKVIQLSGR